ncbi:ATP-binding protein [Streptacidiphilus monticola]
MATAGVDPEVTHEVSIALSEACANAVEHAVPTGAEDDSFQVTATISGDRLRIEVNDSGTDWTSPDRPAPRPVRRRPGRWPASPPTRGAPCPTAARRAAAGCSSSAR